MGEASERPWGAPCRKVMFLFSEVPPEPGSANTVLPKQKASGPMSLHFSHLLSPVLLHVASNSKT